MSIRRLSGWELFFNVCERPIVNPDWGLFFKGWRLIDMPDIFSESLDKSEQNEHRRIFFEIILGRVYHMLTLTPSGFAL